MQLDVKKIWLGAQLLGILLIIIVVRLWMHQLTIPLVSYDEGIILTNSFLMGKGLQPFRDFYTNYSPGGFILINIIWSIFGVSILAERLLGIVFHFIIALVTGRLTGRISGHRFSFLSASICGIWLSMIATAPYAYLEAVAAALISIELMCITIKSNSLVVWSAAGLSLASISFFRHDLFVYFIIVLSLLLIIFIAKKIKSLAIFNWRKKILFFSSGLFIPLIIFWGPFLFNAGIKQLLNDLYFDQIYYAMPARTLPMPPLFSLTSVSLPAFLANPFEASATLAIIGPIIAVFILYIQKWRLTAKDLPVILLGSLAIAVIPQMAYRTDIHHCLYTIAPAIGLIFALPFLVRSQNSTLLLIFIITISLTFPVRVTINESFHPTSIKNITADRLSGMQIGTERAIIVRELQKRTQADEPIFVGLITHRFTFANEMEVYFIAERHGGTRYMQFDPNITNREDIQMKMIADFEKNKIRIALLSYNFNEYIEDNESRREGSSLLDNYIRDKFHIAAKIGRYEMWERTNF